MFTSRTSCEAKSHRVNFKSVRMSSFPQILSDGCIESSSLFYDCTTEIWKDRLSKYSLPMPILLQNSDFKPFQHAVESFLYEMAVRASEENITFLKLILDSEWSTKVTTLRYVMLRRTELNEALEEK